ncbi:hypothetical protein [Bradyrhizobium barranii]|uniref:c-type cytochrome n=1 Tax=Bradyrhizobium barranii TaxID=2992140 RepID=UPI0032E495AA
MLPAPPKQSKRPSGREQPWGAYEARVLQGIWAAAPYLHNGSVPTLAELLKPSGDTQTAVQRWTEIRH